MTADPELRMQAMKLIARAEGDAPSPARRTPRGRQHRPSFCCHDFTCWTSDCPATCYITFHTHPAR